MFNSRRQNVQISGKNNDFLLHIQAFTRESFFCGALCTFLFAFPSHTIGRNDEAAVLFGMRDAEARNRVGGSGGAV